MNNNNYDQEKVPTDVPTDEPTNQPFEETTYEIPYTPPLSHPLSPPVNGAYIDGRYSNYGSNYGIQDNRHLYSNIIYVKPDYIDTFEYAEYEKTLDKYMEKLNELGTINVEINGNETQTIRYNSGNSGYISDPSLRIAVNKHNKELSDEKKNLKYKKQIIIPEINDLETKLNKFKDQVEKAPFDEWLKTTNVGTLLHNNKNVFSKLMSDEYFSKSLNIKQIRNLNDNEKKIYDEFLLRYKNIRSTKGGKPKYAKKTHKKHPKYAKKSRK